MISIVYTKCNVIKLTTYTSCALYLFIIRGNLRCLDVTSRNAIDWMMIQFYMKRNVYCTMQTEVGGVGVGVGWGVGG